jgi:hypothetical protein
MRRFDQIQVWFELKDQVLDLQRLDRFELVSKCHVQVEYFIYDHVVLVKEEFGNEHVVVDDAAYGLVVQIVAQHVQEVVVFALVLHAHQVNHVRSLLETDANKRHLGVQSSRVVSERAKCHSLCHFEFLFENLREID